MTDHLLQLAEFCKGVELAGGTTPHVAMTVESMSRLNDPLEKLWFAGLYALTYNWPMAERIWQEWRPTEFTEDGFLGWAEQNWHGVFLRKERKAVFRKPYFAESAASYLRFAQRLERQEAWPWPEDWKGAYDLFTSNCRYMGRYIAIRWLEVMRRAFDLPWTMTDVRSDGGEHPRKALALIYPEMAAELLGGNSKREVAVADTAADQCVVDLATEYGLELDYYELQSLLCEYKQSWLGQKQYPGKSIDTEMDYAKKVESYWMVMPSEFFSVRAAVHPDWVRGELGSRWSGVRPELGPLLATHGITWSDFIYDYPATTDFAHPVLRDPTVAQLRDMM